MTNIYSIIFECGTKIPILKREKSEWNRSSKDPAWNVMRIFLFLVSILTSEPRLFVKLNIFRSIAFLDGRNSTGIDLVIPILSGHFKTLCKSKTCVSVKVRYFPLKIKCQKWWEPTCHKPINLVNVIIIFILTSNYYNPSTFNFNVSFNNLSKAVNFNEPLGQNHSGER